jgi:plastocyanin
MAALALLLVAAACFSEHGGATGPSAGACNVSLDPSQFGSTIIAIRNFAFEPTPTHVKAGNKVTWLDCEPTGTEAHTTTADGGAWTSSLLNTGGTYTFLFPTPGTFAYHCETHPSMTASIVVDP